MRRPSQRLAGAGTDDEGVGADGPPPVGGDIRAMAARPRGAEQNLPRYWTRVQRCQRVYAAVERLVFLPRRLEPVAHRIAAHEARADLFARELVGKFLLNGPLENDSNPARALLLSVSNRLRLWQYRRRSSGGYFPEVSWSCRAPLAYVDKIVKGAAD